MANDSNFSRSTMLVSIVLAVVLSVIIWPLAQPGVSTTTETEDDIELNTQPVARFAMQAVEPSLAKTGGAPRSGESIYNSVCKTCHETGLVGAPIIGDKAAWAPRLAEGEAAVLAFATNGKNSMPARGGAPDLTDEELKAAVDYLTSKAK